MASLNSTSGKAILMVSHVAGMIDLVALPVWVGTLVQHYGYSFERAGITVTFFLLGAVAASLMCAPRFRKLPHRSLVIGGFVIAAGSFMTVATATDPTTILMLHMLAGLGAGASLSVTHGTIGCSTNPHTLFALAGAALGVFAVVFYVAMPQLIAETGGPALFLVFGALMLLAAAAGLRFPVSDAGGVGQRAAVVALSRTTKLAILGVIGIALNQAIIFSFLERIGVARGFGVDKVNAVLAVLGLVNLLPAALAGVLQHRLPAHQVAVVAPIVQATLAVVIATSPTFAPYAAAASLYAFVMIFAHTFLFGLIAGLDPSGRALAMTPAMLMIGSAIGPALAGFVAQHIGFGGLGVVVMLVGGAAVVCFMRVRVHVREQNIAKLAPFALD